MIPKKLYENLIKVLWNEYIPTQPCISNFFKCDNLPIDHLAIIDFKGPNSGIKILQKIFEMIDLKKRGDGYIADKLNDFSWMALPDTFIQHPLKAKPQLVIADFRNELLSSKNKDIVERYLKHAEPFDFNLLKNYINVNDKRSSNNALKIILKYINVRPWPLPTFEDYSSLQEENPLMAWVLLFGRKVNHFGISIYAMNKYVNLSDFNDQAIKNNFELNDVGGLIKGSKTCGIEQSSTLGKIMNINLGNKNIVARGSFIEFVWRHSNVSSPVILRDYYTDFNANNATNVVESLLNT